MEEKNFKITTKIIAMCICILSLLIVAMMGTYAVVSVEEVAETPQIIRAGTLEINYKDTIGGAITVSKPLSDTDGLNSNAYTMTIENKGNIKTDYVVKITEDIATMAGLSTTNLLTKDAIRFSFKKAGDANFSAPKSLGQLEGGVIANGSFVNEGETAQYQIKVWVDNNIGNNAIGKTFYGKIEVEANQARNK